MYYLIILLVYAAVDAIACLGLSQQFGVAGVTNFGFILFQAAGAYVAAVLALPPDTANGGFQTYIGGFSLPFPIPWIGAALAGGLLALPFTFLVGRRLRGDFAAVGLLVTAVLLNLLVMNFRPLFNGDAGVALVPAPLAHGMFVATSNGYQYGFAAAGVLLAGGTYWFLRRLTESPYGRSLRAMRDNDKVADSLGKNLLALRTGALVTGGAIAGLSGAVLVTFIGVWSPAAWSYAETIVLFTAVIIGGAGNHIGAVLGAVLVPVGFEEITRFITNNNPDLPPNLLPSLQWVAIGLLITVFLWLRPQGILPERKRVIAVATMEPPEPGQARAWQPRPPAAGGTGRPDRPQGELLRTEGLSQEYGGVRAVIGVSIAIERGTLTGLIGPNGAGKSTLLERAIARAGSLLADFGLTRHANDYAGDLSGGQRRLVEIMRALMSEPAMLLLDEPMAGVYPELARALGQRLRDLCEAGMTIVMVEHELAIMDEFCDPVIVMADGSVLASGTMAELRDRSDVVEAYLVG